MTNLLDETGNCCRDQASVWRNLAVSLILFWAWAPYLPFWWMKPLYDCLILRWQRLEAAVREVFVYVICWAYLLQSGYILKSLWEWLFCLHPNYHLVVHDIRWKNEINVSLCGKVNKDAHKFFYTPSIEIRESVSLDLGGPWVALVIRLWQESLLTVAWRAECFCSLPLEVLLLGEVGHCREVQLPWECQAVRKPMLTM